MHKLDHQYIGFYTILWQINPVVFELHLPWFWKIPPIFHLSLLKPLLNDSFPCQHPQVWVQVQDHKEYAVQDIMDSQIHRGSLYYLIDWEGYGTKENSWEPTHPVHSPTKTTGITLAPWHQGPPSRDCVLSITGLKHRVMGLPSKSLTLCTTTLQGPTGKLQLIPCKQELHPLAQ